MGVYRTHLKSKIQVVCNCNVREGRGVCYCLCLQVDNLDAELYRDLSISLDQLYETYHGMRM